MLLRLRASDDGHNPTRTTAGYFATIGATCPKPQATTLPIFWPPAPRKPRRHSLRDFERARAQARVADAALARGERRPLLGVPMTVKESFNVAGLSTSWGLPPFRDFMPAEDAVVVQRLKAAGAVILGRTNIAPGLADWQSDSPVYGRTVHPLDAARTPGRSPGGGAVAVATGMVALELGSDLVGSLRVPAHFCGICAHKPSHGLLPRPGHDFPGTQGAPADLPVVVGSLARCTADLELALQVLAGPDAPESTGYRLALPAPRHPVLRDWRVRVLTEHPLAATAADVRAAVQDAAERLTRAGASVSRSSELLPDLAQVHAVFGDILQTIFSRGKPGATCALSAHAWLDLLDQRSRIRAQWFQFFERFDAVLCPAFGCAAFEYTDQPDWKARTLMIDSRPTPYMAQGAWSGMASLGCLPATAVPLGRNAAGLPLEAQIIGALPGRSFDHHAGGNADRMLLI